MKNKKLIKIISIVVAVLVVFAIVKNPLIKSVVTLGASHTLGVPVKIDSFKFGLFKQAIYIKGFKFYQPKGFPEGILIDIPEISVEYNLGAMLAGKLHFQLLTINLNEFIIIIDKEGNKNIDALKISQQKEEPKEEKKPEKPKKKSKPMKMQIDEMNLVVNKVVVKNYSQGKEDIQAIDVGINKKFENVTDASQIAAIIMMEVTGPGVLKGAGIYGAATILGAGFLPAGVAGVLISKDSAVEEFNVTQEILYNTAVSILQAKGSISKQDPQAKTIKGKVDGTNIGVKIIPGEKKESQIAISARKYMIPKPKVAEGILYQVKEALK